jgi:hypothetical protein
MRPKIPIRWIEEAEARRLFLLEGEVPPRPTEAPARPEFPALARASLTVLLARMTGRVARIARTRSSAGGDEPAGDGGDPRSCIIRLGDLRPV